MIYNIFKIVLLSAFIFLFVFGAVKYINNSGNHTLGLQVHTIKMKEGYGYQITNNNIVLIRQEYIPAVEGKKVFSNVKDAKRVANLVMSKLTNKEDPVVYIKELKSLNIASIN